MNWLLRPDWVLAALIPITYAAMVLIEATGSGRRWPRIRNWQWTGLVFFYALALINILVTQLTRLALPRAHLFDGARLGTVGGIAVGYLLISYGNAWLHRSYHRNPWLWRYVHRLHHAPERIDVAGVMYQSPLESAANALLFVGITTFVLGLDATAIMGCAYVASFYGMFQHFNIHTPQWLGFLIQRPESHGLHHRRGGHSGNFSDLPIWDMLWGSFENPRHFCGEVGFGHGVTQQLGRLLLGQPLRGPLDTTRREEPSG
jgi:sterol desaturase/sphingolipid hydroxylase (fatty acid hydroxylase superfamily)